MRLVLAAMGRLGDTPENRMARDYLARATATGRALGFTSADLIEAEPRKGGGPLKAREAEALIQAAGDGAVLIACDEHGEGLSSRQIAARFDKLKDGGEKRLVLMIGGADGLDADLLARARFRLAFGPQTWPHALVRVMAAEQIYRAVSILAGTPYHRD